MTRYVVDRGSRATVIAVIAVPSGHGWNWHPADEPTPPYRVTAWLNRRIYRRWWVR